VGYMREHAAGVTLIGNAVHLMSPSVGKYTVQWHCIGQRRLIFDRKGLNAVIKDALVLATNIIKGLR